ncbi:MAG: choice-of-anchor D domain-containing protein, partial [Gammaproteobacteria bacterium]
FTGSGTYPHLSAVKSLKMGSAHVGVLLQKLIYIHNIGSDTLHVTGASLATGDAADFGLINAPTVLNPMAIKPGDSAGVTVTFTPSSASGEATQLSIVSDDSIYNNFNTVVSILGTGIYPHLTASNTLGFQFTVINLRSHSNTVNVTNTGTDTLFFYNTSFFTGANPTEFSDTGNAFPIAIPPDSMGTFKVTFNPVGAPGARSAILNMASNFDSAGVPIPNYNFQVTLNGTGVAGAPEYQAASFLNCGSLKVGKSDTSSFQITNTANATAYLIISDIAIQTSYAGDYVLLNPPSVPDTIRVGNSQTLQIKFIAGQSGTIPGDLHLVTNAAPYPFDVALIGQGLKSFLTANAVDFGSIGINKCATIPMHLTNYGSYPLQIRSFALLGANANSYT